MADLEKTSLDVKHHLLDHASMTLAQQYWANKLLFSQQLQDPAGRLGSHQPSSLCCDNYTRPMDNRVCSPGGQQSL